MVKRQQTKKRQHTLVAGLICAVILSLGHFDNPPNGFTNAPGESLCTECHTLNSATQNGSIIFSGFPATINANQTYVLTITVVNPNGVADYAGFQTVILDANNENAGTLSSPSAGSTVTPAGDRTYHEHEPAQMFGMSNAVTWTVNWTAPVGSGLITYYSAANIANGNDEDTGDRIVTRTGSGNLFTPLQVVITNVTPVSCFGGTDGSVTALASFGDPGYTYAWSNGASGQIVVGLSAGDYTVTATDSDGSTATATAEITEPPLFEIVSETVDNVSCNGGSDGLIILELDGGVPPYDGAQGEFATFANLAPGDYFITITDANGCQITEEYFINEPPVLSIEFTEILEPDCFGESSGLISIESHGGTGDIEYQWSNGGTMSTVQNLSDGVYSVTVTDENGCTAAETMILDEPEALLLDLVQVEHVTCNGSADGALIVEGSGGTGDISYMWSNGLTSSSIGGLIAGNYSVTVTDENDCTKVAAYAVTQPFDLSVSFAGMMSLVCFDDATGSLQIQAAGGTPSYNYLWTNGSTNSALTGLLAGTYQVTVTDANGCSTIASAEITEPPPLIVNATSTGESAVGEMDGTASATPGGGTGDYTFLWSNGEVTAMITGLAIGVYTVTVTDESGCTAMQSVAVTGIDCTMLVSTISFAALCFGEASGTAQVIVTGAIGSIEILWSTGDTTMFVEQLLAGTYSVAVEDEAGCFAVIDFTIDEPQLITSICSATGESMEGANDGSITCLASGGTLPYEFLWSNGDTTSSITGLAPGMYFVTITDGNGCSVSDSAFVNGFICMMLVNLSLEDASCFGVSSGSASVQLTGGTGPFEITWSNGGIGTSVDSLVAGLYSITVTDADSCVVEMSFEIHQPDAMAVSVDTIIISTHGTGGEIHITISGGTAPYITIWTKDGGLVTTEEDPIDLSAGDYELLIRDANECMLSATTITVSVASGMENVGDAFNARLWPNPASDILMISSGSGIELQVYIISGSGSIERIPELYIDDIGSAQLDIRNLARGFYYIMLVNRDARKLFPFVKL